MKKSRYKEEQIIAVLKEVDAGAKLQDVIRRLGVSEQTYYRWKSKFGGMEVSDAKKLRSLEDENTKEALTPLEPGSKVGRPEALDPAFSPTNAWAVPPTIFSRSPDWVVLCLSTPPLMDGYPGVCQRMGSQPWSAPNPYAGDAILCGDWLVHRDGKQLAVRSIATGQVSKEKTYRLPPEIACVSDGVVAVSQGRTLLLVALPTFKPASTRIETANGPIEALLAIGTDELRVGMHDVPGFWTASRTCLMSPPKPKESGTHGRH